MLESYDIKEDTESVPMGKILALFVRATHLQSRGLLQMKVQEGFLQFRDKFVEDIPIPMEVDNEEIDQTETIKIEADEFKAQVIKDEVVKVEETEKNDLKTENVIKKEDIKMEEIEAEVITTTHLRVVRRSGRRSKGNTTL